MALNKPKQSPAAPGKFEDDSAGSTAVAERPQTPPSAPASAQPTPAAEAAAAAEAKTAIAKVGAGSLAAAVQTENLLAQMRDAIPAVQFGTFPRLIGANGNVSVKTDGDKLLGRWADLQLLSWSDTYVVSPGSDKDEAKKLVRYSRDGVTIDETGESVNDYLKQLREVDGYKDASKKQYVELIGFLKSSEQAGGPVGELVQVSLSPKSRLTFDAYRANVGVKVRLGQMSSEGVDNIRVTAVPKSVNGKNWTILSVGPAPKQ
jgi:hypothetical protein